MNFVKFSTICIILGLTDESAGLPNTGVCPQGWLWMANSCYYVVKSEMTWQQAATNCRSYYDGADLVKIESAAENWLITLLLDVNEVRPGYVWFGGHDLRQEGSWTWVGGQPLSHTYTNWGDYEPNNAYGDENCLCIWFCDKVTEHCDNHWNDLKCEWTGYSVCEGPSKYAIAKAG